MPTLPQETGRNQNEEQHTNNAVALPDLPRPQEPSEEMTTIAERKHMNQVAELGCA